MRNLFLLLALTGCNRQENIIDTGTSCKSEGTEFDPTTDLERPLNIETEEPEVEMIDCPTFIGYTASGLVTVSDALSIRDDIGWLFGVPTNTDKPIRMHFSLKTSAPKGCGGLTVTSVEFNIGVFGEWQELLQYAELIQHPIDEVTGLPLWRGSELHEWTAVDDLKLATISHSQYNIQFNGPHDEMYIIGPFNTSTDAGFKMIDFAGGEDWRKFAVEIYLGDRLPIHQIMALNVMVLHQVDGINMDPIRVSVPFVLNKP